MRLPLVLAAVVLLAGCVRPGVPAVASDDVPEQDAPLVAAKVEPTTGTLVVVARMPDQSRLAGVNVTAGNVSLVTGPDGIARFERMSPGHVDITARKEAHRTAQLGAEVAAGQTTTTEAVLPVEDGGQHAHENGVFAHRDLYAFKGHFDCSATYVIVTGDCFLLLDNVTTTAGAPVYPGDATEEHNLIPFALDLNWTTLVVELKWTPPAPGVGDGMTLALEPAEAPADGHAAKYARVAGGSPLRVELKAGVKHETATAEDMPNPEGGEVLRARAYVMGLGHHPAGTDYLGVGVSAKHDFELFVSIFYGEAPPADYTAIGGA